MRWNEFVLLVLRIVVLLCQYFLPLVTRILIRCCKDQGERYRGFNHVIRDLAECQKALISEMQPKPVSYV